MREARHYLVRGRVQGVGFRFFTQRAATVEGLHGWVRNCADGSVEAQVEGEAEAILRFERQLRHGPTAARVDDVDTTLISPTGHDTGFSIR